VTNKALGQGRDEFIGRCATCHGSDGRGATPIGSNLYPRVPDLRGPTTQALTDGEIRYIIANGIQLTGMPAMPVLNGQEERASWALVTYLRSLRSATPAEAARQQFDREHRAVPGFTRLRALPWLDLRALEAH
jgi:mono/diheme cytochrome c family protein